MAIVCNYNFSHVFIGVISQQTSPGGAHRLSLLNDKFRKWRGCGSRPVISFIFYNRFRRDIAVGLHLLYLRGGASLFVN